jgi:ATP-dependent Clp protease ATP-binding subunit ClpX
MIPELIGRLPVVSSLRPLDEGAMLRVLTEPKNALVKQYQAMFSIENQELSFTESALRAIAHRAMEKDTGARALRSIVEDVMLDAMFDLPDQTPGNRYVVGEETVLHREKLVPIAPETKQKSA